MFDEKKGEEVQLRYQTSNLADFGNLVTAYPPKEFDSPYRSTIPHLSLWRDPIRLLASWCPMLGLPEPRRLLATFEFQVPPVKGIGKPSHTDLMLEWESHCVAIEAKYTEPPYEKVKEWLAAGNRDNRNLVLEGWCDLINRATGGHLKPEAVHNVTYQVIHRIASACHPIAKNRLVLYQGFDLTENRIEYYISELESVRRLLHRSSELVFAVVNISIQPTPIYSTLQKRWEEGERSLRGEIIAGLIADSLMSFSEPEFMWVE